MKKIRDKCKRGHVLNEVGTYGKGACRQCGKDRSMARYFEFKGLNEDQILGRKLEKEKNKRKHIIDRFMDSVEIEPNTGCWLWTGSGDKDGYGRFNYDGSQNKRAHRASYELFIGEIEKGMMILHSCDVPECVNYNHLRQGSAFDNMADMANKGRGKNQKKTHCPYGHEYTVDSVYKTKTGNRVCKICMRERDNKDYQANREKILAERKKYYADNKEKIQARKKQLRLEKKVCRV